MSGAKNQHYVPQFYLRKFAINDEQIYVFNKFTRKQFVAHVRNVASETGFYDLDPEVQRAYEDYYREHPEQEAAPFNPKSVENALSELESHYAAVFDNSIFAVFRKGALL